MQNPKQEVEQFLQTLNQTPSEIFVSVVIIDELGIPLPKNYFYQKTLNKTLEEYLESINFKCTAFSAYLYIESKKYRRNERTNTWEKA